MEMTDSLNQSTEHIYAWALWVFSYCSFVLYIHGLRKCHGVLMVNVSPAEDAREAVKYGVDGILVSNHGARQLDGVPATVSFFWRNQTRLSFLTILCSL